MTYGEIPVTERVDALRRNDVLTIRLEGVPLGDQGNRNLAINEDGMVALPYIPGGIKAEGLTPGELSTSIRDFYRKNGIYKNVEVAVIPPERQLTVGGYVGRPGPITYREGLTFNEAIQAAGGYQVYGIKDPVILNRNGRAWKVDGDKAEKGGYNPRVFPGDHIQISLRTAFGDSDNSKGAQSIPVPPPDHLKIGDALQIAFQGVPAGEAGIFSHKIDESGNVSLPYVGLVKASGLTAAELQNTIQKTYVQRGIYPNVTIAVLPPPRTVSVGGNVNRPGPVPMAEDLTLSKAIEAAGGFTAYAKRKAVLLLRDGKTYELDADAAAKGGFNPRLYPNDVLTVPQSNF